MDLICFHIRQFSVGSDWLSGKGNNTKVVDKARQLWMNSSYTNWFLQCPRHNINLLRQDYDHIG